MDRPSLTYIVPVYNTGGYLHECLGSISWSGPGVECVVVDDGSTDSSPMVIRDFVDSDPRFRAVTQENMGLSAARNRGLAEARGKYVLFVDSDDVVDADGVMGMLGAALENDADIVTGNLICIGASGELSHWGRLVSPGVYATGAAFLAHMYAHATYFPMAQCYMVRRRLLSDLGLSFAVGIMHEDELWTPGLLLQAGTTVASGINHYGYRTGREQSLTHNPDPWVRFRSLLHVVSGLGRCCRETSADLEKIRSCAPFLRWRIRELSQICRDIASRAGDNGMDTMLRDAGEETRSFLGWLDEVELNDLRP